MPLNTYNKKKIINDPVYGFITIPSELIYDLIENPWVQRLRRIKQLGLTYLVYPGAMHTRFQHAIGAMHLMQSAVDVLRSKGHEITPQEEEAVLIAILLHDVGHGPFSHVLEHTLVEKLSHEELSILIISEINKQHNGGLDMALAIFTNQYHKHFLHQMVSGQLDMDRLDYLKRDSFFSGVSEGVIGSDRIIKMLNVFNDQLVVEAKGVYSIEKFLIARRLMYWQVYLHKTVLVAENQLVNILRRARSLINQGMELFAPPALAFFMKGTVNHADFSRDADALRHFGDLDDNDLMCAIKAWSYCSDPVLALLSSDLMNRRLNHIEITNHLPDANRVHQLKQQVCAQYGLTNSDDAHYFVRTGRISNHAYSRYDEQINILFNNQQIKDISEASDMLNLSYLDKTVTKHFLSYPKSMAQTV